MTSTIIQWVRCIFVAVTKIITLHYIRISVKTLVLNVYHKDRESSAYRMGQIFKYFAEGFFSLILSSSFH